MKFSEYAYERPNVELLKGKFNTLFEEMDKADTLEKQKKVAEGLNELRIEFNNAQTLVSIRHSINTEDEFYKAENDYMDENDPIIQEYFSKFYKVMVDSPFREGLEEAWGKQFFNIAEQTLRTFSPEIIEDLQLENKLCTQYSQLIASAKIEFEGEERTLSQLTPFQLSTDRNMRKRASEARFHFMAQNEDELDRIYDELVGVRTRIAHKLGYPSFVELGYDRMLRTDYNAEMVANFRKQVVEEIVPVCQGLKKRQAKRLQMDTLKYYDEDFKYTTGNATPKGTPEQIIANGAKMYKEMSPETDQFFSFMQQKELMDLVSKKGKQAGGYCTYLFKQKVPFIFSNFNGTYEDVDVLTHEVGHAFQVYQTVSLPVPEYAFPTSDAAEIHSMSMEFFAWPWMELFFEEDADKYRFSHLAGALEFIPYGVLVDEFQHVVYSHPEATPAQRKQYWRELEQKYLPHRDYDGLTYLEQGGFWQKQSHIYTTPFYYIDYTLAQLCALQFWKKSKENFEQAWQDYYNLCKAGGSLSFLKLVELAGLQSPFEDGTIHNVIKDITNWLNGIDDQAL